MKFFPKISAGKSGNREVALSLLMYWGMVSLKFWFFLPPADHAAWAESYDNFTKAILLYTAAAFGFNYAVQQGVLRGSTERNRRTEDHQPGAAHTSKTLPAD